MPEKNEKGKQKLKKPVEVSAEAGITIENEVKNVSGTVVYEAESISPSEKCHHRKITTGSEEEGTSQVIFDEDVKYNLIYNDNAKCLELFILSEIS